MKPADAPPRRIPPGGGHFSASKSNAASLPEALSRAIHRRKRPGSLAQRFSVTLGLMLALVCVVLRGPLVGMFISGDESEIVREMAQNLMIVNGLIQPVQMLSVVASGALRGAGDVKYTARVLLLTVTGIRPILALVGVYVAGTLMGRTDIALITAWTATLCDMSVRMVLMMKRYAGEKWHSIRV